MSNINLEEGKINFEGKWLTADELADMIHKKMGDGDLKFATMAAALEELKKAMEEAHVIEETIVLEKQVYDKLLKLGGGDEKEGLRKAVQAYIHDTDKKDIPSAGPKTKKEEVTHLVDVEGKPESKPKPSGQPSKSSKTVKCTNCKNMIPVLSDERPVVVNCPQCGTSCRVTL